MNLKFLALCSLAIVSSAAFISCEKIKVEISTSYTDTPPIASEEKTASAHSSKPQAQTTEEPLNGDPIDDNDTESLSDNEIPEETTFEEKTASADSSKPQAQTTEESLNGDPIDDNDTESLSDNELSEETTFNVTENENSTSGEYSYSTILDSIYYMIVNNMDYSENVDGTVGIREAISGYENTWEALNAIGYSIQDLSGDGIPELIFASNLDNYNNIFAVYSCAGDNISLSFYGSARSSYRMLYDGNFYYNGSGGAAYSYMGKYRLSEDGKYLITDYAFFTDPDPEDNSKINIYRTTSDSWEISDAELMEDMTLDEFADASEDLYYKTVKMDLIPLSEYTPTE